MTGVRGGERDLTDDITEFARGVGLDRVGVCDAAILTRARDELFRRKAEGLSDTMEFTYRNPERATDPSRTLPEAQSILVAARSYRRSHIASGSAGSSPDEPANSARVAAYAQENHYGALRLGLNAVASRLRDLGHQAVVVADENNLVDREVAWRAGIGWFGKNANLLLPGAGSWFVLGSIITTAPLRPTPTPVPDGCGTCRRCIDACPTQAIVSDGVIDARRCLAWLVQKAGVFPVEYRVALHDRLYGCDDCQDSCPITIRLGPRVPAQGIVDDDAIGALVDIVDVLESDDDTVMSRFSQWYIPQRNPNWVRRNALIILGNVATVPVSRRTENLLVRFLASSDPYLRAHAVWSARRLGCDRLTDTLREDPHPVVRAEMARDMAGLVRVGVTSESEAHRS